MNSISRTDFLAVLTAAKLKTEPISKISLTGIEPYDGKWGDEQILHLIRRCLFGVSQHDCIFFSGKNLNECLAFLLAPSAIPEPPVNVYNENSYTDPDVPEGKTWVQAKFGNPEGPQDSKRVSTLKSWWVGLMLNQDRSLTEKMTLFWSNHLAAQMSLMKDARFDYGYVALIREYALGNFKQLVREVTTNPGMLEYLNGRVNTAVAPNENYARELQELFTVGKGKGVHFTEEDVKQAARVLTGWKIKETTQGPVAYFNEAEHDFADKRFSNFYNNTIIKGKKGKDGIAETDALMDMLFAQHEVARYVCRNLYRWFVYYNITELVEQNIIEPLADIFIKSHFEITPVLHALLGSRHFFDEANRGVIIKNPVDVLVGACRQFGLIDVPDDIKTKYKVWNLLSYYLYLMGMDPGDPPNVSGWSATYQFPTYSELWINSTTLAVRNSTTDALLSARGLANPELSLRLDILAFTKGFNGAGEVNQLIKESTALLCPMPIAAEELTYLKGILLSGQTNEYYWADAWKEYILNSESEMTASVVYNRLSAYYTYILQRAEYQLY